MKTIVTIDSRNQITIPKSVCKKLGICPEDQLTLDVEGDNNPSNGNRQDRVLVLGRSVTAQDEFEQTFSNILNNFIRYPVKGS